MSETKERELLPCAHCGSDNAKIRTGTCYDKIYKWQTYHQIECVNCNIQTCKYTTEAEAIAAWNRRPAPAWTTEVPTEDGYYFYCTENDFGVIEIEKSGDDFIFYAGKRMIYGLKALGRYFDFEPFQWCRINVPALPGEGGQQ